MILCCGEALIDMIPEPTKRGPDGFVPHPGGAIFNTAIALGRLEAKVGLLSGLSTDLFGAQLIDALTASNVDTSHVMRSDRPTTLAVVQLEDGKASYAFFDENSAGRMIEAADLPKLSAEVSALYFGGISLACEPAADTYAALCVSQAAYLPVMIDPNIRPGFISDETAFRERLARMFAVADIIKVSDEDLDWLVPQDLELAAKAQKLLAQGSKLVVVTCGAEGAWAFTATTQVHVPSQKVAVVDTVGAGDTFNAGVLAALSKAGVLTKSGLATLEDMTLKSALEMGSKVAAFTVSQAGANPPWVYQLQD